MRPPRYPSPEVYDHIKRKKKTKKHPIGEYIPRELWYLAVTLAALMVAFLAIITR